MCKFHGDPAHLPVDDNTYLGPAIRNLDNRQSLVEGKDNSKLHFDVNYKEREDDI